MNNSGFFLKEVFFLKTCVEAIQKHKRSDFEPTNIQPVYDAYAFKLDDESDDSQRFAVVATMIFNEDFDSAAPYHMEFECMAFFEADSGLGEVKDLGILYELASPVLTGAIREMVATLTSRHLYGSFILGLEKLKKPADA